MRAHTHARTPARTFIYVQQHNRIEENYINLIASFLFSSTFKIERIFSYAKRQNVNRIFDYLIAFGQQKIIYGLKENSFQ